ncbi:glycosyltransferase family 4 protein [Candidatus Uhrbacteria bacterium]|nr:glycosyltransferase family 4 protein [Candidatus Uhrbacteria bacterium]
MKIAEVSPVFPPYRGGIGMVCYENARMATELGHTVDVYTPYYAHLRKKIQHNQSAGGIRVHRLRPFFSYGNAAALPQLFWRLRKADLIHLHYPFLGAEIPILLLSVLFKKRFFLTYHMDLVGTGQLKNFFRWYTAFFLPSLIRRASRICVTSVDYARNSYVRQFLDANPLKFFELHNCVDVRVFFQKEKKKELLGKHEISPQDKVILFVGSLDRAHYFKGVMYLLEAFEQIVHTSQLPLALKLVIVGDGNMRQRYQNLAAQLQIETKVVFVGSAKEAELPDYYALADVLVLPSVDSSEAFGIVLIEAFACGKPVIASNLPGVRSVVEDSVDGYLVEPRDVNDLAIKIYAIISDSDRARIMGQAGLEKAKKIYSFEAIKKKFSDILTVR